MNNSATKWILACSFATASAGFLLPFWPLSVAGILLASLSGRWTFAIAIGLLFDIAYGAPMGNMKYLYFPFTAVALLGILARIFSLRYLFNKNIQEKL